MAIVDFDRTHELRELRGDLAHTSRLPRTMDSLHDYQTKGARIVLDRRVFVENATKISSSNEKIYESRDFGSDGVMLCTYDGRDLVRQERRFRDGRIVDSHFFWHEDRCIEIKIEKDGGCEHIFELYYLDPRTRSIPRDSREREFWNAIVVERDNDFAYVNRVFERTSGNLGDGRVFVSRQGEFSLEATIFNKSKLTRVGELVVEGRDSDQRNVNWGKVVTYKGIPYSSNFSRITYVDFVDKNATAGNIIELVQREENLKAVSSVIEENGVRTWTYNGARAHQREIKMCYAEDVGQFEMRYKGRNYITGQGRQSTLGRNKNTGRIIADLDEGGQLSFCFTDGVIDDVKIVT